MTNKKEDVTIESFDMDGVFSEAFHTSLRKYLDTIWSTAAWNFVHILLQEDNKPGHAVWKHFCDHTCEQLKGATDYKSFSRAMRSWARNMYDGECFAYEAFRGERARLHANTFYGIMKLMDDESMEGLFWSFHSFKELGY